MSGSQDELPYRSLGEISCDSTTWISNDLKTQDSAGDRVDFAADESKQIVNTNLSESFSLKEIEHAIGHQGKAVSEDGESNEEQELELDNLFSEDLSSGVALPTEFLTQQKEDKLPQFAYGYTLGNIDEIWKKVTVFNVILVLTSLSSREQIMISNYHICKLTQSVSPLTKGIGFCCILYNYAV